ncbi:MAG TPA: proton-conducting transporter membrane subunit [Solirubrobacterales bacterium]|nr:proton-conducting transporter membrane subunit [Solirubrobacterales bacterium]
MTEALVIAMLAVPLAAAPLVALVPTARAADRLSVAAALVTAALALVLAGLAIADAPDPAARGSWFVLDAAAGVFLALVAVVGLASALVSPAYLRHAGRGWIGARRSHVFYYAAFHVFWAVLLALPLVDNLALAWILVEASTATSALLVAYSGKRAALEAGWKYVVLTTLGLAIALFGIVVLFVAVGPGGGGLARLDWSALSDAAPGLPRQTTLIAFILIIVGLATKVGWAPVHNWLPDAHSEAPPPISAMLSAALLPTVLLIAWRTELALGPALSGGAVRQLFLGFGLLSLAIAIPFLWRPQPWKRLLAYSSLEHMGILALGIGFGTPLAIAGVVVHVVGHGIAKSLGFYTAIPLLRQNPGAARLPARGLARTNASTAVAAAVSLVALAGLPPSPLFVSEVMVLLGGMEAGLLLVAAIAAVLLALGFLGLAHALIEALLGGRRRGGTGPSPRSARAVGVLAGVAAVALVAVAVAAYQLPGSSLVEALMRGAA